MTMMIPCAMKLNKTECLEVQCLYQASLGGFPPKKTAAKLCALNLYFCPDNGLHIYHGNLLLMDNKHMKLVVIKQSRGCKFMPKMHQNTFGGGAAPGSAARAYALPRPPSRNGGLLLIRWREGKGGEGPTYKGRGKGLYLGGRKGRQSGRKGGERIPRSQGE